MERRVSDSNQMPRGISLATSHVDRQEAIFTPEAVSFVARLTRRHGPALDRLLAARVDRRARMATGEELRFLPETKSVRDGDWKVASIPSDLLRRHVEITGPVDRKMIINALNSGADCFMADFEDSSAPTWDAMVAGQVNLRDAVAGTISLHDESRDKHYRLNENTGTLLVRPRGLHLVEQNMRIDGKPVPAGLFDFALYFFHNAHRLLAKGSGPYFYLPKLESHREARWWNDVFVDAQEFLGLPIGSIKVTMLIETLPAAFEMHELMFELRQHSVGLNCGRWDYIFSYIKTHRERPDRVLPDRSQVTMEQHCMHAYSRLVIQTCHRRGAHAIGGMAAQIPIKGDDAANQVAMEKVRRDKLREVTDGHDGTWVAHPALVTIAREIFDDGMPSDSQGNNDHQQHVLLHDLRVSEEDLLRVPEGTRTEEGLRLNVRVGIQYVAAWLEGLGCVPLYNLMEDAATAEISRAQVWQWVHHGVELEDQSPVTVERISSVIDEEMVKIQQEVGDSRFVSSPYAEAAELFRRWCCAETLEEFLTSAAYARLIERDSNR